MSAGTKREGASEESESKKPELQKIPARHGVATFVPVGQVIKVINTSGSQVVDTWAFALPRPSPKDSNGEDSQLTKGDEVKSVNVEGKGDQERDAADLSSEQSNAQKNITKKGHRSFPSQEEAEKSVQEGINQGRDATTSSAKPKEMQQQQKNTWSSYVPSIGWSSTKDSKQQLTQREKDEQVENSRTWASYFPSGKAFSSYVPKGAQDTLSSFAATHSRDPKKSYLQQLQDFSRTPVGAAGLSALTGSGYSSSLYAGYSAWTSPNAAEEPPMEYMSMPHTRAMTLHISPKVGDVLVSNLREPILSFVEDTSPGVHDTLIAACDPQRYKGLGVEKWEEHGSCAENLVLALKELNERAGLKGAKAVGADVTINSVPAPFNLFMNIPWNAEGIDGRLSFDPPETKPGDYVRLKAERDVVVVMSACPQDILKINNQDPTDAHFIVEEESLGPRKVKQPVPPRRQSSRALQMSRKGSTQQAAAAKKPVPLKRGSNKEVPKSSTPFIGDKDRQKMQRDPKPTQSSGPHQSKAKEMASAKTSAAINKRLAPAPIDPPTSGGAEDSTPRIKKKPRKLRSKTTHNESTPAKAS